MKVIVNDEDYRFDAPLTVDALLSFLEHPFLAVHLPLIRSSFHARSGRNSF